MQTVMQQIPTKCKKKYGLKQDTFVTVHGSVHQKSWHGMTGSSDQGLKLKCWLSHLSFWSTVFSSKFSFWQHFNPCVLGFHCYLELPVKGCFCWVVPQSVALSTTADVFKASRKIPFKYWVSCFLRILAWLSDAQLGYSLLIILKPDGLLP